MVPFWFIADVDEDESEEDEAVEDGDEDDSDELGCGRIVAVVGAKGLL